MIFFSMQLVYQAKVVITSHQLKVTFCFVLPLRFDLALTSLSSTMKYLRDQRNSRSQFKDFSSMAAQQSPPLYQEWPSTHPVLRSLSETMTVRLNLSPFLASLWWMFILHAVLVIGFMNEIYTFSEPNPGTVSQTEQICIEIKSGRIASPLSIVARWTAGTATGI